MATEPTDRTIILHLLRGALPERADEIGRLWSTYGHAIEVTPSKAGVTMNANATRIQFDTKTIDFFWLLGFSAWHSIEVYYPALFIATTSGIALEQALQVDEERAELEALYKQRVGSAHSLLNAPITDQIPWPSDLPMPTADRERLDSVQHMAAFDLVALALAFTLLHEFRHVMFLVDANAPPSLPEEELACDAWAREFVTSHVGGYARGHNQRYADILNKRAMGIALAAIIIHAMTPNRAHWGNRQYPPIAERITAMIANYCLAAGSSFWTFTACLLIGVMRQENRPLNVVAATDQDVVNALLEMLR